MLKCEIGWSNIKKFSRNTEMDPKHTNFPPNKNDYQ